MSRRRVGQVEGHGYGRDGSTEAGAGWEERGDREYETLTFGDPEDPFRLECGGVLPRVTVAYETYGQLSPGGDNAVLVCHALTGDSHVSSRGIAASRPGWWEGMVGPGRALDTRRYFVVCSNVLGGCRGTTGPSSTDPGTSRRYSLRFPLVTVRDMVRVQRRLVQSLGVNRLVAVIGGSLGGMQALQWAVDFPEMVQSALVIGAPAQTSAQSIALNQVQREAILSDPAFCGGEYDPGAPPARGLALARMLGMITYQSETAMEYKFARRMAQQVGGLPPPMAIAGPLFEVERYLEYQGEKLVRRFDANTYLYLTRAMDLFDVGAGYGDVPQALQRVRARVMTLGVSSDVLYPAYLSRRLTLKIRRAGGHSRYVELRSPWGHDAFLIELDRMRAIAEDFLAWADPNRVVVRRAWARTDAPAVDGAFRPLDRMGLASVRRVEP